MLSKWLLIFGFLLMSWQWAQTMPSRNSGQVPAPPPAQNGQNPSVQSIFDLPPNCKPGEVATGPHHRCRHQA
ncbi:uncharacterized protein LOC111080232 [Drosophila obscura]|uniref:uncharacterized protein LOC111080232 n=1 Tax=Drosophila obscura TaxID=7282 RepID=UPI001BB21D36|nr:uncharacterized protein LOC111080232 [Drosophila obscura]